LGSGRMATSFFCFIVSRVYVRVTNTQFTNKAKDIRFYTTWVIENGITRNSS